MEFSIELFVASFLMAILASFIALVKLAKAKINNKKEVVSDPGMEYFSCDIETTGLVPGYHKIIEFSMIRTWHGDRRSLEEIEHDGDVFHTYMQVSEEDTNTDICLTMNAGIIDIIRNRDLSKHSFLTEDELLPKLGLWLHSRGVDGPITVAGKNFAGFDMQFIKMLPNYEYFDKLIRHRVIDPSMYFVNWNSDASLPNLATCLSRAKLDDFVSHTAKEDAWQVIQLLRAAVNKF